MAEECQHWWVRRREGVWCLYCKAIRYTDESPSQLNIIKFRETSNG